MSLLASYLHATPVERRNTGAIATLAVLDHLAQSAPKVAASIVQELKDQRRFLKMIASENYSSLSVQLAMGNWLTDKYAEGFPHHRFYAGCEQVDSIEEMACTHLKELFQAEHAYVQPHSGADANLVAFWSIITKRIQTKEVERLSKKSIDEFTPEEYETLRQQLVNQRLLGMSLNSGGHLTHGYRHNVSSKFFQSFFYDVDPKTNLLNYDEIRKKAKEVKPLILLAGYSAYSRRINFRIMREIADEVGATLLVDMAHFAGLVAGKVFQGDENPIAHAHMVTSTTHKTLRGPRGGIVLATNEYKEFVDKGCPLVLGGPLPHVIAAKSIAFQEAKTPAFQQYAQQIVKNAKALAEGLMRHGIRVITGGTDNHLVIIDVSQFSITGRQAETALRQVGITANRNAIPFDAQGPWYTSGVRLGTPALTTLGMKEAEMEIIASIIAKTLSHTKALPGKDGSISKALCQVDSTIVSALDGQIKELLAQYPLYPELPELSLKANENDPSAAPIPFCFDGTPRQLLASMR